MILGVGCRVQDREQGSGFRVQGAGCRGEGCMGEGCMGKGVHPGVEPEDRERLHVPTPGSPSRVWSSEFGVQA